MELIMNKKNAVCIKLTKNELQEMGFTYKNLNFDGIKLVNKKIYSELGINLSKNGESTLIEAFPDTDGDCLLFLMNEKIYYCNSDNIDDICRYSKSLKNLPTENSKLCKNEDGYILIITILNPALKEELMLSEFCMKYEKNLEKYQKRKTVINTNALQILSNFI